jgi:hypothetical protein
MAVRVEPDGDGGLRIGVPEELFEVGVSTNLPSQNIWAYSPHPDGQRFLVNAWAGTGQISVNLITNWHEAATQNAGQR